MPPQFLVVGHIAQDLISPDQRGAWRLGGTVAYASRQAHNLGLRAAILTAASADLPLEKLLPEIECRIVPSDRTTRIHNVYTEGPRHQYLLQRAASITAKDLPSDWRQTPIVLLGPVAGEVDEGLAGCFSGSLLGVGAQGWLREIGVDRRVRPLPPARWRAGPLLKSARVLFVSDEDLPPEETAAALKEWSALVTILAFTRGHRGADVCLEGVWRHIDAFPAEVVDPTGAGDAFAAAFLIRLGETGDVWQATQFAAGAASLVVEGQGMATVPNREQVEARLRQYPDIIAR